MYRLPATLGALAIAALLQPSIADARCDATELVQVGVNVRVDLACRASRLAASGATCTPPATPACAAGAYEEIAEIVFGDPQVEPATGFSSKALACQRSLALASARFVGKRTQERAQGQRRAASARGMRLVGRTCGRAFVEQNPNDAVLPAVGGSCAGLLGAPDSAIDGTAVERCVRASLERIVDDLAPEALRPNVVLILTDDQRADSISVMPTVSSLRSEGLTFTNAFTTSPLCTPSRVSFLTGLYAHHHGVLGNWLTPFDDTQTIATWLAAAGYTNGLFGKYRNGVENFGETVPPGWHDWHALLGGAGGNYYGFGLNENGTFKCFGSSRYSTDLLRGRVLTFIRAQASRPFFAMFTPFAPHEPWEPAQRHLGLLYNVPLNRPPSWLESDLSDKPTWVKFLRAIRGEHFDDQMDENRLRSLQTLLAVDDAVAKIREKLESLGIADNTVIVYTSDHGIHFGEHWLSGKFDSYEESVRIPLVVHHPGRIPAGETRDELVLSLDQAPTIAELAGAAVPQSIDGESYAPLFPGGGIPWRDELLIESPGEFITPAHASVRTASWKYIDLDANSGITEELYDLVADPYELQNVAQNPAYASVLADMQARLAGLLAE
ncbi:MAG: sulfatase [Deltaproteobacteria bacterium]|nr:sulfatase [Deltaproteobacteria bacterium]